MEISQLLAEARQQLASISDTPALDGQVVLAHLLGRPRAWLLAHGDYRLADYELRAWQRALEALTSGLPLPYLLGRREFYGLNFAVTPQVLIPRPETEELVSTAIAWLKKHPGRRRAVDIGAGSGCIGVSLAVHIPDLRVLACDLSRPALRVAVHNANQHGVLPRFFPLQVDLLPPLSVELDLICANLPYISSSTLAGLAVYGREPTLALDGGPDGLAYIRRLIQAGPRLLAPGGCMLLEIEASQGAAALELARRSMPASEPQLLQDLAGFDRLLVLERPR